MKKFNLAVAFAAVATMAVASSASAKVERYQEQDLTFTAKQPAGEGGFWTHTYNVKLNPCDGSFVGQGSQTSPNTGPYPYNTTITGVTDGNTISFMADRADGVKFWLDNAVLDGTTVTVGGSDPATSPHPWLEWTVDVTSLVSSTDYKNHGEYVRQAGNKADAAHSCIGMPIR